MKTNFSIVDANQGLALQVLGVAVEVLADSALTGGQYTAYRCTVPPQVGPPPHRHDGFDEAFYVVAGVFEILVGSETHIAEAGSFAYIPRGVVHTFRNVGEMEGQFIGTATPGGHERFFEDADALARGGEFSVEDVLRVCAVNGIEVAGSPR